MEVKASIRFRPGGDVVVSVVGKGVQVTSIVDVDGGVPGDLAEAVARSVLLCVKERLEAAQK